MTFEEVERRLNDGIERTEEERAKCLSWIKNFAKKHDLSPTQMDDICFKDSVWVFDQIFESAEGESTECKKDKAEIVNNLYDFAVAIINIIEENEALRNLVEKMKKHTGLLKPETDKNQQQDVCNKPMSVEQANMLLKLKFGIKDSILDIRKTHDGKYTYGGGACVFDTVYEAYEDLYILYST